MSNITSRDIFADRLKQSREKLGLTQEEFGAGLDLAWFQIRDLESGKKRITPSLLESLEGKYYINMRWLISGEAPMFLDTEHDYSDDRRRKYESKGSDSNEAIVVRVSSVMACCGNGIMTYPTEFSDETIMVNKKQVGKIVPDLYPYAVQTTGRSMVGYGIEEGSLVIINPAEDVYTGSLVLVVIDETASIKKLYERNDGIDLAASNGTMIHITHEDLKPDAHYVRIMGKVVLVISHPNEEV